MKDDKTILKIEVSHDDPEIEKQGAEAIKDLAKLIGELMGEKVEFYSTEKEAQESLAQKEKE